MLSPNTKFSSNKSLDDATYVYFNCLCIVNIHHFKWDAFDRLETSGRSEIRKIPN